MKSDTQNQEGLVDTEECPCDICTSQDSSVDMEHLNEVCDIFSNQIIDLVMEKPEKYLLKRQIKQDKVK